MVTRIGHARSWRRRWVQMVMMVQELTPWPRYIPPTCGSAGGPEPITSCSPSRASCQTRIWWTRSSGGAINKTRVDICSTGEGLMVVPGHNVALSTA